jgi:hypothetical protein
MDKLEGYLERTNGESYKFCLAPLDVLDMFRLILCLPDNHVSVGLGLEPEVWHFIQPRVVISNISINPELQHFLSNLFPCFVLIG